MAAHGARGHDIGKMDSRCSDETRGFWAGTGEEKRGREEEDARKGRDDARKKRDDARRKEGNTNVSPSKLEERCTVDAVMQ